MVLQSILQWIENLFNTQGGAALLGGLIGIVGVVVGYFSNIYLERYKVDVVNRKKHYDEIKKDCFEPLYKRVCDVYLENFNFGQHIRYKTMSDTIIVRIAYYYDYLSSGKEKFPDEDWGYFYDFYFRRRTEGLDLLLYNDLDEHFPYLKEELRKYENFISVKGMKARENIFHLSKFIYQNQKYKNFIKKVIRKNPNVEEHKIRKNYFIFTVILLLTSNEVLAKDKVLVINDLGLEDECMRVIEPYLGSLKPYMYKKERVASNNSKVEEIWQINLDAENLFNAVEGELQILKHKPTLPGNCEFIK